MPVRIEDEGGVRRITLDAPERLNALSNAMIADLHGALDDAGASEAKVVVLAGAGRAFCAGHDLSEMQAARQAEDGGKAGFLDLFERCAAMMTAIPALPQPVIAEVHGVAVAAGCQLAASCDMVVAEEGARFGVNGVNIGLFCSTPMVALTRAIPRKAAFEMLTTGRLIDADEAQRLGLVNRIAPEGALREVTMDLAGTVAGKLGPAVRIGKRAFHEQVGMGLDEAYAHTGAVMAENLGLDETAEGMSAFLEKRPPSWA
ncbi:MAG: enoyl-CoA hydratase [Hasllibacter sp.]